MTLRYELRPFRALEDYRACVALQEETWGVGFSERVPTAILKVAQSLGGVAAGAFDGEGRLAGFVFGMTGPDESGEVVHWSDMLAVRAEAAGSGLGVRLKAWQRDSVVARGVRRMLWTFDPLRARNAHLNLNKLGAVVREYRRDMYGDTDSVLHRGIGTDRFVAVWLLESERVAGRMERALSERSSGRADPGRPAPPPDQDVPDPALLPFALQAVGPAEALRPGSARLDLDSERVGVAIPADIGAVMHRDAGLAVAWREATRETLMHYLERGYEVRALMRREGAAPVYVLSRTHRPDRREDP
ncbi:MAG: GNAT family N-acetyltransferase [Gemmatimonadota bacterium]